MLWLLKEEWNATTVNKLKIQTEDCKHNLFKKNWLYLCKKNVNYPKPRLLNWSPRPPLGSHGTVLLRPRAEAFTKSLCHDISKPYWQWKCMYLMKRASCFILCCMSPITCTKPTSIHNQCNQGLKDTPKHLGVWLHGLKNSASLHLQAWKILCRSINCKDSDEKHYNWPLVYDAISNQFSNG